MDGTIKMVNPISEFHEKSIDSSVGSRKYLKLAAISDIHFPSEREVTVNSVNKIASVGDLDVLIVAGDIADSPGENAASCLDMLNRKINAKHKLIVPGNHDLWSGNGRSLEETVRKFDQLCESKGFHNLENGPVVIGNYAFAGNIGWYDYSFLPKEIQGNPIVFTADRVEKRYNELTGEDFAKQTFYVPINEKKVREIGWNDVLFVKKKISDIDFCNSKVRQLERDIINVKEKARHIIAVTHTAPHMRGVDNYKWPDTLTYAWHGSDQFRKLFEKHKISFAIFGHEHAKIGNFKDKGITYAHAAVNRDGQVPIYKLKY